jgi:hypothetical protein
MILIACFLLATLSEPGEFQKPPCEPHRALVQALEQGTLRNVPWHAMDHAACLEDRGDDAGAAALYRKILQATEGDVQSLHWYAKAQVRLGLLQTRESMKDMAQAQRILDSLREAGALKTLVGEDRKSFGILLDRVADHLLRGDGLPMDREKAIRRFRESHNLTRSEEAALALGKIWVADAEAGAKPWTEALEWLDKGGPAGHLLAATCLLEGRPGLPADRKGALEAFRKAAADNGVYHRVYEGWNAARQEASLRLGRLLAPEPAHLMEALRYLNQAGKEGQQDIAKLLASWPYRLIREIPENSAEGPWKMVPLRATGGTAQAPVWLDGDLLATQLWGRLPDPDKPDPEPEFENGSLLPLNFAGPGQWLLVSGHDEHMAVALVALEEKTRTVRVLAQSEAFGIEAPICICGRKGCDHFSGVDYGPGESAELRAQAGTRRLILLDTHAIAGYAGGGAGFRGYLLLDVQEGGITPLAHLPASYELSLRGERTSDGTWENYAESAAWRLRLAPGPRVMPDLILTSKKRGPGMIYRWDKGTQAYVRSRKKR